MTDDSLDGIFIHVIFFSHGDEVLPAIMGLMFRIEIECSKDILIVHEFKNDITTAYVHTGVALAKVYAPAVGLGVASLGCMFGSHHMMTKRNASLTAAYIALDKAFEEYRTRVTDRFGDRVQQELEHNVKAVEIENKKTDENGVEETIKQYTDEK